MNKTDCPELPPAIDSTARQCIDALVKSQGESEVSFRDLCGNVRSLARDVESLRDEFGNFVQRINANAKVEERRLSNLRVEFEDFERRVRPEHVFAMTPKEFEAYELGVARGKELALERPGREAK